MKIAALIARLLLGVIFTVFGLNGFFHFLPMGPQPAGAAGQFLGALYVSHYLPVIFGVQLVCGLMFLFNQYVPLALTLIAPVIVNIVCFHALMAPSGLPLAAVVVALWLILASRLRSAFSGILQRRVQV